MSLISIIVPVYNDALQLEKLIPVLRQQQCQYEFELIFVDNGSTDNSREVVRSFSDIVLLEESTNLSSPYSARNRGIEFANGDIVVLLDATCTPAVNWLEKGVSCLRESGADIVGGNVLFDFENSLTVAKVFDSLTNIKMQESIEQRGVAKTANLFMWRAVFDEVGMFPEGVRSGADVRWTGRATEMGKKLIFCQEARVFKIARGFSDLIRKQWRVGKGRAEISAKQKKNTGGLSVAQKFFGIDQKEFRNRHLNAGNRDIPLLGLRLLCLAVLIKFIMVLSGIVNK